MMKKNCTYLLALLLALPLVGKAQIADSISRRNNPERQRYIARQRRGMARDSELSEITVRGGGARRVNESAYNVTALDTRALRNTTLDLSGALDRMAGVKIRQEGGLGSAVSLNVGGFTGRHIRLFIDGMPMEGAGSSFGLQNIPISLSQRLEVYKGVVPVELGGDALGGAVNIVTDRTPGQYVDASYSLGKWNTHRIQAAAGTTTERGWVLRMNAYRNSSDNNYKVRTQWTDLTTMAVSQDEAWFRRFHDRYHNEAVSLQGGVVDKRWANRLLLGLTWSHERADVQNANLQTIVFGGKYRTNTALSPTLVYEKYDLLPHLTLRLNARYDYSLTNNTDTVSRTYNWAGDWRQKLSQGEGVPTLAEFKSHALTTALNLKYALGRHHLLTLNDTYINYRRQTTDDAENARQQIGSTYMQRKNQKNILGLSYKVLPRGAWNAEAFAKHYMMRATGPVNVNPSGAARYEERNTNKSALGYGAAATYFLLNRRLQVKGSYEKTYRLPTERELFGDGDYEDGTSGLKPEHSHNLNLNLTWDSRLGRNHFLHADVGAGYRDICDYIIRSIDRRGVAVSTNHGHVRGWATDITVRYSWANRLQVGGNLTLQNLRDRERTNSIGAPSATYDNRVPNQPYTFANADASYTFRRILHRTDALSVGYNLRHVHRFFRTWAGYGAKLYIPTQWSHDLSALYSLQGGRYNIGAEVMNFTNALLYDNYSLQKPGRSFAVKFRYSFRK